MLSERESRQADRSLTAGLHQVVCETHWTWDWNPQKHSAGRGKGQSYLVFLYIILVNHIAINPDN